jgi:DNA-binding MltR family transcriptional regulator
MKPIDLSIDDYHKAVELFHGESDRSAAVLAGSFIESYLAKYMRSFMIDDECVQNLFDGFGPFSDFYQRFEASYALGFITNQQRTDLKYIAKIRNHFAHHPLVAGFDKPPVSDFCRHLSTYDLYPLQGQETHIEHDNRYRYLVAISLCIGIWHNSMLERNDKEA